MKPRRRSFATPFIVTVGLAGCTKVEPPPTPISQPTHDASAPDAGVAIVVPVDATPTPTPMPTPLTIDFEPKPGVTTYTLTMAGKSCQIQYNMHCPMAASCNPPRPSAYKCPTGMTPDRKAFIATKPGETDCTLTFETKCGAEIGSCTEGPPARKIKCP